MSLPEDGENKPTEAKLQGYAAVLSIGSTRCKANQLGKGTVHLHRTTPNTPREMDLFEKEAVWK